LICAPGFCTHENIGKKRNIRSPGAARRKAAVKHDEYGCRKIDEMRDTKLFAAFCACYKKKERKKERAGNC
jgi:hypothetical protein